jgi:hypothetical protein
LTTAAEHAFNHATRRTLTAALEVCDRRGDEYGDTWHADNLVTTFLDATLRSLGVDDHSLPADAKRLLLCAALIDVKDSRMLGPWKADTVEDGLNYRAAYRTFRDELDGDSVPVRLLRDAAATGTQPSAIPAELAEEIRALCREAEATYWSGDQQFAGDGKLTGTELVPSARLDALEARRAVVARGLAALGL